MLSKLHYFFDKISLHYKTDWKPAVASHYILLCMYLSLYKDSLSKSEEALIYIGLKKVLSYVIKARYYLESVFNSWKLKYFNSLKDLFKWIIECSNWWLTRSCSYCYDSLVKRIDCWIMTVFGSCFYFYIMPPWYNTSKVLRKKIMFGSLFLLANCLFFLCG